ncbi:unnamed protein product [Lota lota]
MAAFVRRGAGVADPSRPPPPQRGPGLRGGGTKRPPGNASSTSLQDHIFLPNISHCFGIPKHRRVVPCAAREAFPSPVGQRSGRAEFQTAPDPSPTDPLCVPSAKLITPCSSVAPARCCCSLAREGEKGFKGPLRGAGGARGARGPRAPCPRREFKDDTFLSAVDGLGGLRDEALTTDVWVRLASRPAHRNVTANLAC